MTKTAKKVAYGIAVAVSFMLVMAIAVLVPPAKAHAAELTAGKVLTTQSQTTLTTQVTKATNPYSDVTVKKVGKNAWQAVKLVKDKGGYKGIIKGTHYEKVKVNGKTYYKKVNSKFLPSKKVTRSEFLHVLGNLYGSKNVPVTYSDVVGAKKVVTAKYACNKMVGVAKKLGYSIKWQGKNTQLNRAATAQYIYAFASFSKGFMPK